jgi:hypothetical protein
LLVLGFVGSACSADEPPAADLSLPTIKFFYYDAAAVEWIVSAEPAGLARHLESNEVSRDLFQAVTAAVNDPPAAELAAGQMARWIENERERFEQTRREAPRIGMAEGVIAYLRADDFSIQKLVADLKHRSGATDVELVVIHLRDAQGNSAFKLKVVLVDPKIEIGKQGFNIDLQAPNANYTVVSYALGVALYNVQEIIHGPAPPEPSGESPGVEPLPLPPREPPVPPRVPAPGPVAAAVAR